MRTIQHILLLAALTAGVGTAAAADSITIKGSDTIVILAQKWAEAYMKLHPDVKIEVTGGGSGIGLAALQNQSTDIADASRRMKPKEIANCVKVFGRRPTEYKVCLDGLSVYVNEHNPLNEVTIFQLERVFTGKYKNWKELGGADERINVYGRENSSGTYEFFKEHVLEGQDYTARTQTMPGTAAVIQAVAKDKNGIGYGGVAYGKGTKILKVKQYDNSPAIAPTEETVLNKTYPIWRYCYNYVNPALDRGIVADYLRWIRTDEGQKIVKEVGYFPLPPHMRIK